MSDAPGPRVPALRRLRPHLLLFVVSFALWWLGAELRGGRSLFEHDVIDQHTLQAIAWLDGRLDLGRAPGYLEVAELDGRYYDSFPPTPAVLELPFVIVFGRQTPNSIVLYAVVLLALFALFALLKRRGFAEPDAALAALAFVFGTNLYVSCVKANVWAQGQGMGFAFAVIGLAFVVANERRGATGPGLGYLFLSLAVGCRPFYVFMAPLFVVLDWRTSGRGLHAAVVSSVLWMAPYGVFLGLHNWARFGSPAEFGHTYLQWAKDLPRGIFSVTYVPRNLFHAVLKLPRPGADDTLLEFDPWGTAFWLHNGIFLFPLYALFRGGLDGTIRLAAAASLVLTWSGLLMHETNGWRQFGYRYLIDLLPTAIVLFAFGYRRWTRLMLAALVWSLAINLYGLATWKELPRNAPAGRGGGVWGASGAAQELTA